MPPESVFVHTYVLRPHQGGGAYEFRSDHFSGGGRRIEDFSIDLSGILGKLIFDEADQDAHLIAGSVREAFTQIDSDPTIDERFREEEPTEDPLSENEKVKS